MNIQQTEEDLSVGERLAKLRVALGFKAEEFAASLEISRGYLSQLENGRIPGEKVVAAMRRLLQGLTDYVLTGEGEYVIHGFIQGGAFTIETSNNAGQLVYIVRTAEAGFLPKSRQSDGVQMTLQADEELLLENYRSAPLGVRKKALALLLGAPESFAGNQAPKVHQDLRNASVNQIAGDIQAPQTFTFHGKEPSPRADIMNTRKKGKN